MMFTTIITSQDIYSLHRDTFLIITNIFRIEYRSYTE